ncbi:thioesterase II family protein, partial [Actinosynnema sp. NPDC059797]
GVVRVAVGRRTGGTRSSTPWFLAEPDPDARVRVLCFPYSGCGASMYQRWPARRGEVDFVPVQFPFRENRTREPHFGTYERLADALVPGIEPYLDRPYVLFSHCGGVLPAYESALRAAELGLRPPSAFIASSQVVPHHGPYGRFLGLSVPELDEEIRTLLRRMGSRETFSDEIIEIVRDVLVADLDANRRYSKPAPALLPCRVTAVGWDRDVDIPSPLMDAWTECSDDVDVVLLRGDHYSFLEAPEELVELIVEVAEAA